MPPTHRIMNAVNGPICAAQEPETDPASALEVKNYAPASQNQHGPTVGPTAGDLSEIQPGLWVGNAQAACDPSFLKLQQITHVLNCTSSPSAPGWDRDKYLQLDLEDQPQSATNFRVAKTPLTTAVLDHSVGFIKHAVSAGGAVLVHCQFGRSRSVAVASAYLMVQEPSLSSRMAQALVEEKRNEADVNTWFQRDLVDFQLLQVMRRQDPGRQIERVASQRTLPGQPEYALSVQLGNEVSDRIDILGDDEAVAVYRAIGYVDDGVMGAVGNDPKVVRAALQSGTLHERIAHCLSFFDWLAVSPDRRHRLGLQQAGGDLSVLPRAFMRAKAEIVIERHDRGDRSLINTETAGELGLEVSCRQRRFWGQDDFPVPVPPFRRPRLGTRLSPWESRPVAYRPAKGQTEFCGPSTHAFYLIRLAQLLGYDPVNTAILAEVYLASIGAHTRHEVEVALNLFQQEER